MIDRWLNQSKKNFPNALPRDTQISEGIKAVCKAGVALYVLTFGHLYSTLKNLMIFLPVLTKQYLKTFKNFCKQTDFKPNR